MLKKMIPVFILSFVFLNAKAQSTNSTNEGDDYQTAVGVKFYPGAISIKHFIADDKVLEGLAYFGSDGFRATGLYEFYGDITGVEGLKWYAGPGAHIGFWNTAWQDKYPGRNSSAAIGIDGVVGIGL